MWAQLQIYSAAGLTAPGSSRRGSNAEMLFAKMRPSKLAGASVRPTAELTWKQELGKKILSQKDCSFCLPLLRTLWLFRCLLSF